MITRKEVWSKWRWNSLSKWTNSLLSSPKREQTWVSFKCTEWWCFVDFCWWKTKRTGNKHLKHDFPEFWTFCETTLVFFFQKYAKYKSRASKCFWNQVNPLLHRGETRIPGIPRIQPDIIPKSPNLRSRILRFSIQKWSEFLKTSITCNFLNFYRISIIFGVLKPDNFSLQKRIRFW